jgi:hypothetical protein
MIGISGTVRNMYGKCGSVKFGMGKIEAKTENRGKNSKKKM